LQYTFRRKNNIIAKLETTAPTRAIVAIILSLFNIGLFSFFISNAYKLLNVLGIIMLVAD